jgi:hypothetical protein
VLLLLLLLADMKWLSSLRSLQTLQLSHCSITSPAGANMT